MLKRIFITTVLLSTIQLLFGQQIISVDNEVYTAIINSEIIKTTASVTIINALLQNDKEPGDWVTQAIQSQDPQQLETLRFSTRDDKGNNVRSIDTATQHEVLRFYKSQTTGSALHGQIDVGIKVFMIARSPFKKNPKAEWKKFYKKYPGSGGLFQFSNISYAEDGQTAVCYHSHYRNGLNAHGALAILTKINGAWLIKYHIDFWLA
ncbi:MAG: hypothetical protein JWR61_3502 [Ferruginibacter sp.]|uniref:hypothetical protein n=1 Tax=Ferruginibacter sp. TaxID=1940288 RepID=UPI00265833C1|nr:hypothetical protein [Ferruginibacter sp.]MDB5278547.1 hypothetical protein [Ferruginibacter sp.]